MSEYTISAERVRVSDNYMIELSKLKGHNLELYSIIISKMTEKYTSKTVAVVDRDPRSDFTGVDYVIGALLVRYLRYDRNNFIGRTFESDIIWAVRNILKIVKKSKIKLRSPDIIYDVIEALYIDIKTMGYDAFCERRNIVKDFKGNVNDFYIESLYNNLNTLTEEVLPFIRNILKTKIKPRNLVPDLFSNIQKIFHDDKKEYKKHYENIIARYNIKE